MNLPLWLRRSLVVLMLLSHCGMQWAALWEYQPPGSSPPASARPCADPGTCFASQAAKDDWAKQHNCTFAEVKCEDTEASTGSVEATARAVARFADGLVQGLKDQVVDLWEFFKALFTNPGEIWEGLKTLGKMVVEDPQGAAQLFMDLLGDDANKLIRCGAFDQGRVIGKYVSPFFALKVARLVGKAGGKVAEAVEAVKKLRLTAAEAARLGIKHHPEVKRPNGSSWFDEANIKQRGVGVENALGNNTPDAFPVIDRFDAATGEVTSIKSKSPDTAYWAKPGGLRDSLKVDIRKLADFVEDGNDAVATWEKGTPGAGTEMRIRPRQVTSKTLLVAVKRGALTEAHYAEIRQAQAYADQLVKEGRSTKNIKLVVVEIP